MLSKKICITKSRRPEQTGLRDECDMDECTLGDYLRSYAPSAVVTIFVLYICVSAAIM